MIFNHDEINLMCIYNTGTRNGLMAELEAMRTHLEPDEQELRDLTDGVLDKLSKMNDADFAALDLYPDFSEEDADDE